MTLQPSDLHIYVIRHGETAWSRSGQHTGRTDLPLSEPGEAEARALAPWLRGIHFGHVLTSPLRRARRTCELATCHGCGSDQLRLSIGTFRPCGI